MNSFATPITWLVLNQLFEDDGSLTPYLEDTSGQLIADHVIREAQLESYDEFYEALAVFVQLSSEIHKIIDEDLKAVGSTLRSRKVIRSFYTPSKAKSAIRSLEQGEIPNLHKADLITSLWLALKSGEEVIGDFSVANALMQYELAHLDSENEQQ